MASWNCIARELSTSRILPTIYRIEHGILHRHTIVQSIQCIWVKAVLTLYPMYATTRNHDVSFSFRFLCNSAEKIKTRRMNMVFKLDLNVIQCLFTDCIFSKRMHMWACTIDIGTSLSLSSNSNTSMPENGLRKWMDTHEDDEWLNDRERMRKW